MENYFSSRFECPTLEELERYAKGKIPKKEKSKIEEHLFNCGLCLQEIDAIIESINEDQKLSVPIKRIPIPQSIRSMAKESLLKFNKFLKIPTPSTIELGQLWSTKGLEKISIPKIVVIIFDEKGSINKQNPDIHISTISFDTHFASNFDLIVGKEKSPFGFEFMIETWNSQPMLKANLNKYLGILNNEIKSQLKQLLKVSFGLEADISHLSIGTAITDPNDIRIKFQEKEIKDTIYLRKPVNLLLEKYPKIISTQKKTFPGTQPITETICKKFNNLLSTLSEKIKSFIPPFPLPTQLPTPAFAVREAPAKYETKCKEISSYESFLRELINKLDLKEIKNKNLHFTFLLQGLAYLELNKLDEAEYSLEKAIKIAPDYIDGLILLSWIYYKQMKNKELNQICKRLTHIAHDENKDIKRICKYIKEKKQIPIKKWLGKSIKDKIIEVIDESISII